MRSILKIVPMPVDGEHGHVMLVMKACGCWVNFRARRSHKCAAHMYVQTDYILKGGAAARRAKAISAG